MDKKRSYKSEDRVVEIIYKLGLILLVFFAALFFFLRTEFAKTLLLNGGYSCSFKEVTGLNCPGCGGTRAVVALARLDIAESFRKNASVLVALALYIIFMVWESLHRLLGIKGPKERDIYIMLAIFVVTVLIRWYVCNFTKYRLYNTNER